MKERPILFSGPMVQAIVAGRKTQTRRAMKPQPEQPPTGRYTDLATGEVSFGYTTGYTPSRGDLEYADGTVRPLSIGLCKTFQCPFGMPGDRLWVRETHRRSSLTTKTGISRAIEYRADEAKIIHPSRLVTELPNSWDGWRPSIHMPRWASRITLGICSVRVERLQGIGEADCYAEGCLAVCGHGMAIIKSCKTVYRELCESVHGRGAWEANPWVWVIEFRRLTD